MARYCIVFDDFMRKYLCLEHMKDDFVKWASESDFNTPVPNWLTPFTYIESLTFENPESI